MKKGNFTITPESGNGNGTINVSAPKYYGNNDYTNTIQVKTYDNKVTKTVTIKQKANTKIDLFATIIVAYKGQFENNYIFDVEWSASTISGPVNICTEPGTYFTPMLSKDGENIELYNFGYVNNSSGSRKNITIPVSSFNGINPLTLSHENVTADWDLKEQSFEYKFTTTQNIYKQRYDIGINAVASYDNLNKDFSFTLKNMTKAINSKYGDTVMTTRIEYICGGLVKKSYLINNADLNTAVSGKCVLPLVFTENEFVDNTFELKITDAYSADNIEYNFIVNLIKAQIKGFLDDSYENNKVTFTAKIQYAIKGNTTFSNITTSEGDRYVDDSVTIPAGSISKGPYYIDRTDSVGGDLSLNYYINSSDALREVVKGIF